MATARHVGELSEVLLELHVLTEYAALNETLWVRMDIGCNIVELALGVGALAAAFGHIDALVAVGIATLLLVCVARIVLKPLRRSHAFGHFARHLDDLCSRAASISAQQLRDEFWRLRNNTPRGTRSLWTPAWKRVMKRYGLAEWGSPG